MTDLNVNFEFLKEALSTVVFEASAEKDNKFRGCIKLIRISANVYT